MPVQARECLEGMSILSQLCGGWQSGNISAGYNALLVNRMGWFWDQHFH